MDENAVIAAVCDYLEVAGYDVTQRLHTTEHGVDVVARNRASGSILYIEAKGGTSSRDGSARYGKGFNSNQVYDRVAKAVYAALCLRATYPDKATAEVGLAVPDTPQFRKRLEPIRHQLLEAGLIVLLVDGERKVSRL